MYKNSDFVYYMNGDYAESAIIVQPVYKNRLLKKHTGYLCRKHNNNRLFFIRKDSVIDIVEDELVRQRDESHYWGLVTNHQKELETIKSMLLEAGISICPRCNEPVGGLGKYAKDWSWNTAQEKIHDDCIIKSDRKD